MESNFKIPEFLKRKENNLESIPPNIGCLLEEAKKEHTLLFYYGSYFDGVCEFLIMRNHNGNCQITAEGSNGYMLSWNIEVSIDKLKPLEKVVQPARKWLRDYEAQDEICDGYGWGLIFIGTDYEINARGYEAYPFNYYKVGSKILRVLNKLYLENATNKEQVMLPL